MCYVLVWGGVEEGWEGVPVSPSCMGCVLGRERRSKGSTLVGTGPQHAFPPARERPGLGGGCPAHTPTHPPTHPSTKPTNPRTHPRRKALKDLGFWGCAPRRPRITEHHKQRGGRRRRRRRRRTKRYCTTAPHHLTTSSPSLNSRQIWNTSTSFPAGVDLAAPWGEATVSPMGPDR
ncbi:hypothetical protein E2C01_049554 [Portunus trituberculatus]|uniref:Uncharacterized protein n=1 Tax=Portunus trituberculatus TaxID=210409 RepID=A0A5B7G9S1_PORTR|nr:hypothetical protein [Portunus trituberculatus]